MQLDRRMLERVLNMNDEQLRELIEKIAAETGIDPSALGLNTASIDSIRQALGSATDGDLQQLGDAYDSYRKSRRGH